MSTNGSVRAVLLNNNRVATIRKTSADDAGHNNENPWILEYVSGRIDRFRYRKDVVNEALKSFGARIKYRTLN